MVGFHDAKRLALSDLFAWFSGRSFVFPPPISTNPALPPDHSKYPFAMPRFEIDNEMYFADSRRCTAKGVFAVEEQDYENVVFSKAPAKPKPEGARRCSDPAFRLLLSDPRLPRSCRAERQEGRRRLQDQEDHAGQQEGQARGRIAAGQTSARAQRRVPPGVAAEGAWPVAERSGLAGPYCGRPHRLCASRLIANASTQQTPVAVQDTEAGEVPESPFVLDTSNPFAALMSPSPVKLASPSPAKKGTPAVPQLV